jgi:transcription elongation GreA/GreB family factor
MTSITKEQVLDHCTALVKSRIEEIKGGLEKLAIAKATDGKSSMGDKYETSRELLAQEERKLGAQFGIFQKHGNTLTIIRQQADSKKISLGSLVQTTSGWFFLGPPLGQLNLSPKVFCLSLDSPMGAFLQGKSIGDSFELNGRTIEVLDIIS